MNRLIIIGAGGHGRVIADIAMKLGYADICFLDDNAEGSWMGCSVVGKSCEILSFDDGSTDFVIGIGNNAVRKRIAEQYAVNWVTLIHPSAQIAIDVKLGVGTVVMAGAIINASARVGAHCIINTGAIVEHDNALGDYVHISPRAALAGTVHVGDATHVGIGAVIRNNLHIIGGCVIGAGAVVVKNIESSGTYIGVPARKMK